jgi:hypothetical protein
MNLTTHFLMATLLSLQSYELPRVFWVVNNHQTLDKDGMASTVTVSVYPAGKKIKLQKMVNGGVFAERHLETSFFPTAIAPVYPDHFYVMGAFTNGAGIVEKWQLGAPSSGPSGVGISVGGLGVKKTLISMSTALMHARDAAVSLDESFLLFLHLESGTVKRLELATGEVTTFLESADVPCCTLSLFSRIRLREHYTAGYVWVLSIVGPADVTDVPDGEYQYLMLWDGNADGDLDSIEPVDSVEYTSRHYHSVESWYPDRYWYKIE